MNKGVCYGTEIMDWDACQAKQRRVSIAGKLACDACIGSHLMELNIKASVDELTNLPSKRYFRERFNQLKKSDTSFGALFVDLRKFKAVNDSHGHAAGDRILIAAANYLQQHTKSADGLVARIGGDEFGLLLEIDNEELLGNVAERLQDQFMEQDFVIEYNASQNKENQTALTISGAMYSRGMTIEQLMSQADPKGYGIERESRNFVWSGLPMARPLNAFLINLYK